MTAILAAAVGGLFVALGWLAAARQRQTDRRRELRTDHLVKAYRRLEGASNHRPMTRQHEVDIEVAIADIVLLGDDDEVKLAREFSEKFAAVGSANTQPLLERLRRSLRKELRQKGSSDFVSVRITRQRAKSSTAE